MRENLLSRAEQANILFPLSLSKLRALLEGIARNRSDGS